MYVVICITFKTYSFLVKITSLYFIHCIRLKLSSLEYKRFIVHVFLSFGNLYNQIFINLPQIKNEQ